MAIHKVIKDLDLGTYMDVGNIEPNGKVNPVLPAINSTPLTTIPTLTGNTSNKNEFVIDPLGRDWFIDYAGDAKLLTQPQYIRGSGRAYLFTDLRWVTNANINNGVNNENFDQNEGTGVNPNYSWQRIGDLIKEGTVLSEVEIAGFCNSTEVTNVEVRVALIKPTTPALWDTGFDANAERIATEILATDYFPAGYTGTTNDYTKRILPLGDTVVDADSFLAIYYKPSGTITATRYFRHSYSIKTY